MRRGGYAFFASRRCDIFTADLCNSIMPKTAEVAIAGRLVTSSLSRREDGCGAVRLQFRKALCVDVANM